MRLLRRSLTVDARVERAGTLTGFSVAGGYVQRVPTPTGVIKYIADPAEISVVDRPCNPMATFASVKAGGTMELRKFAPRHINKMDLMIKVLHED